MSLFSMTCSISGDVGAIVLDQCVLENADGNHCVPLSGFLSHRHLWSSCHAFQVPVMLLVPRVRSRHLQDTERNIAVCHTQARSSAAFGREVFAIVHTVCNLIIDLSS